MNGAGVARCEGMAVFVKNALPGESVTAKIINVKSHYAYALPLEIGGVSPMRSTPSCPLFGKCGGCTMQHIKYADQLRIKKEFVETALKKAGVRAAVCPTVASDKILRYRNKMSLPAGIVAGETEVGLYAFNSHRIVPCDDCLLQPEWNAAVISAFRGFLRESGYRGYDAISKTGEVRHLVVRETAGFLSVTVVAARKINVLPFADRLRAAGVEADVYLNINTMENNVILGDEWHVVSAYPRKARIDGFYVDIHPAGFFQVNDYIRDKIYAAALDIIANAKPDTVIDAYSGAGLMTAMFAKKARRAIGIEINARAVDSAKKLIRENAVHNAEAIEGDVSAILPRLKKYSRDCAVVLDPPRSGCDERVLKTVIDFMPNTAVYISCNPGTLARDLAVLSPVYDIKLVQPYDMFPMTDHVETLVLLCRKQE